MKATISHQAQEYHTDLSQPIDISLPLRADADNITAWYLPPPEIIPVMTENFKGSVARGGDVNFNTITFNPHAHGTHTECVGHITKKSYSINKLLQQFLFPAVLISIAPEKSGADHFMSKKQIQEALKDKKPEALVIRTLPNGENKKSKAYSNTNWPYFTEEAAIFLREIEVMHLLVDVPSIDKEKDGGKLLAHKAFWNTQGKLRKAATITEMIYVPQEVKDGCYLLHLQIAPFENDASPSKPILYALL